MNFRFTKVPSRGQIPDVIFPATDSNTLIECLDPSFLKICKNICRETIKTLLGLKIFDRVWRSLIKGSRMLTFPARHGIVWLGGGQPSRLRPTFLSPKKPHYCGIVLRLSPSGTVVALKFTTLATNGIL